MKGHEVTCAAPRIVMLNGDSQAVNVVVMLYSTTIGTILVVLVVVLFLCEILVRQLLGKLS